MRFRFIAISVALVGAASATQLIGTTHVVEASAQPQSAPGVTAPGPEAHPLRPASRPSTLNPDPLHTTGMLIEVSIATQRFTAWNDGRIFMTGLVSTGKSGYDTPTGRYHVIFKSRNAWSAKWGVVMPWALNIHGNYFIHQLTHYPNSSALIGASQLGTRASHGCVRVGVPNAELLYRWARVGTPVWIH
jgi:lipoprotein-anchoring transpeptidase ErfK/SrfK